MNEKTLTGAPPVAAARLTPFLKYLMATGCGVVVANIYYCQPLLGALSRAFHVTEEKASVINICSQAGYGLGLLLLVPLGDKVERRTLIVWMHLAAAVFLAAAAMATNVFWMDVASLAVGMASTACQVFIPLAAHLARDEERGNVIGVMMGGLLTGVLLSRTLSGVVADYFGWSVLYFIAAGLMLIMAVLMWYALPREAPAFKGSYAALMRSLAGLFRTQPVVRESALIGGALFGAISAFWATLAFFLEAPPYRYSLSVIGLFGVIGTGGALVSPYIGRITDRSGPFKPMRIGVVLMLLGYAVLFAGTLSVWVVVAGVVLLDVGLQAAHVPNHARNYSLLPEARTRLNTIYMSSFFLGGTLGSSLGSVAWNWKGWPGVCITGLLMVAAGGWAVWNKPLKKVKGEG
ncbi:MFS transporter [Compostibacter hankyongensis]|uniref:MFS transporter n=1 Tax=Compostibacter hankyongensis TaxID=1007089 RepID=A0ABP8G7H3_9BACT